MHGYRVFGGAVKYFTPLVDYLAQKPLEKMCLSDPSRTPSKEVQALVELGLRECVIAKNSVMGKHCMTSAEDWEEVRMFGCMVSKHMFVTFKNICYNTCVTACLLLLKPGITNILKHFSPVDTAFH